MSKRAEVAALKAYPECAVYNDLAMEYDDINGCYRAGFEVGYEQAEKELIPLINRLCKAILLGEDAADLARGVQAQIKAREE